MNYTHYPTDQNDIYLVDMSRERQSPFSELAEKWITKFLKQGKHIAIITNKKGRSTWMICESCGHIPKCDNCDISVKWHKDSHESYFWLCHICKSHYPYTESCSACSDGWLSLYGTWIDQLSMICREKRWEQPLVIKSSQVNSPSKIKKIQTELNHIHPQILIGTSLLTTPPVNLTIDMVIVLESDWWLHSPHFSASRNNFCFLSEIIRNYTPANIIFQSYNTEQPSILYACTQEEEKMKELDSRRRKEHKYPPYAQIWALLYKHEIEKNVHSTTDKLYKELMYLKEKYEFSDLEIYPTPPMIYKIYGKYRYNIILKSSKLRQFMEIVWSKLNIHRRWFKMDWEPMSL